MSTIAPGVRQHPRTLVRTVYCTYCGAQPGHKCIGKRDKLREQNHMERVELARRTYGEPR